MYLYFLYIYIIFTTQGVLEIAMTVGQNGIATHDH